MRARVAFCVSGRRPRARSRCNPAVGTPSATGSSCGRGDEPIVEQLVRGRSSRAGAPLLRLDERRLGAQAARAQATRNEAAARLAELERGPRAERIREARARLVGAESAVANSEREYERSRALELKAYESVERRDQLRAARDQALARRDQARIAEAMETGTTSGSTGARVARRRRRRSSTRRCGSSG